MILTQAPSKHFLGRHHHFALSLSTSDHFLKPPSTPKGNLVAKLLDPRRASHLPDTLEDPLQDLLQDPHEDDLLHPQIGELYLLKD